MRKLLAFLFLIMVAFLAWAGARMFVHRGEAKATIVFTNSAPLRRGDLVLVGQEAVGEVVQVAPLAGRSAVTVRLRREHRRDIVTDSLFTIDGHRLIVTNAFAVGRPIDDGTIIMAPDDKVSGWMASHAAIASTLVEGLKKKTDAAIDRMHDKEFSAQLDDWNRKLPEWKSEGKEALARHLAEAKAQTEKLEARLAKEKREDEAHKLKERFTKWLNEVNP